MPGPTGGTREAERGAVLIVRFTKTFVAAWLIAGASLAMAQTGARQNAPDPGRQPGAPGAPGYSARLTGEVEQRIRRTLASDGYKQIMIHPTADGYTVGARKGGEFRRFHADQAGRVRAEK